MAKMADEFQQINAKLDRVEAKLDDHLMRISKVEEAAKWTQGYIKIMTAIFLGVCSWIASRYFGHIGDR